ncbi:protein BatD [Bdellovibrio sp. ZAP7]|uniref:BatD family protein n=1 Tax=Bdellovibrio sp. ZAP7 TaxID=2231053 RepID=UPI001158AF76|nr:BatD family protein [Bdellovibrio sp. ZAP7]QDK44711.1 protein BatD [Bdellovibrio sp. ZAP7]
MTKIGRFLIFLTFILNAVMAMAAGTTVNATVDRNEMRLGDTFTVTVSAVSSEDVDMQEPRVPELDGFELLNTWSSTAVAQKLVPGPGGMQFETQRRKEYSYSLAPKRQGTLSISSFEVVVGGKVFRTQPIVIKVGTGGGAPNPRQMPQRPQAPQFPGMNEDPFEAMDRAEEEMFNQLLQQRQRLQQQIRQQQGAGMPDEQFGMGASSAIDNPAFRSLPTNPNDAFFIGVEVDKTEVYEGEQVTVNWYIYTRGQMETLDRLKFPDLRGFWKEIIEEVPSIQFYEQNVGGIPWKKALLASHALFPIKAGTATIDSYKIKSRVRTLSQLGMMSKPYEYTKSSASIPIKVKPLPVDGRPSDFSGAVGQFDVHATIEGQSFPVNQPLSLKVRFEGAGNAKLIDLPAMTLPTGLEQYDTKSDSKFFKNGRSYKEFEMLLIPRQEGDMVFPGLSVSMFDPKSGKYYTKKTEPITLKIVNNPNAPVGSSQRISGAQQPAAAKVVENKLPDVIMAWQPSAQAAVMARPWLWIVIYAGIITALLVKSQREFGWGRRRRTLKEQVAKRYKVVDQAVGKDDYRTVGAEMTNIFYMVMGQVAGESGASQKIEDLMTQIPPSLRRDHGDEITKTFEVFQTLSFAPDEMLGSLKEKATVKQNIERAKKVISELISSKEEK